MAAPLLTKNSEKVLWFAFASFFTFAIVEMFYGIAANSLSLVGDSASMIVDSFTYLGNGIAMRRARHGKEDKFLALAPAVSATVLFAVMIYILVGAFGELLESGSDEGVKIAVVLIFGCVNLMVDFLNLYLFFAFPEAFKAILMFVDPESMQADGGLNIRSALSHIIADTWRSVALIVAAFVGMRGDVSSSKADAIGAIVVEVPIFIMVLQILYAVAKRSKQQALRSRNNSQHLVDDKAAMIDDDNRASPENRITSIDNNDTAAQQQTRASSPSSGNGNHADIV